MARLIAELSLKDKLTPGVNKALGSVGKLETGLQRATRGAGQVASGLGKAGTRIAAGLGLGLAGAAKAAIDWEEAFTGVIKTVDEADLAAAGLSFDDIADGLRKMSTEMPNTALELAGIAESAGAMGVAGKDILSFTKQVAILASTTNVSAEDAATALGQLQNIIGLTGDEFDNFAASLVDLGNKGSSTEAQILEIARRAGGAAKLFGVAKEETLGWAAAAANLGLNEELAGTALQNVFVKLLPKYTQGAKDLQQVTGKTAAQLKKAFKEDAGGAIEDLIQQLGEMPKDKRLAAVQDLFGKGSGLTRLVLGLAESYDKNLAPALDTATESWEEATAAQLEFDKRNATVRSSIARLKNGIIDAAVSVGEGFTPALGRAATKLSEFLAQDANRSALKAIGEDIGKAIDQIDWKEVVDGAKSLVTVMKSALDFAKKLYDAFNLLPTPIKGALAGVVAIDKLSGGLVGGGLGGIIGGLGSALAKSMAASIPLFGRAFVQPVFVTNMGGLGGGAGAAAGAAGVGIGALLLPATAIAAVTGAVTQGVNDGMAKVDFEGKFTNPFQGGLLNFEANIKNFATLIPQLIDVIDGGKGSTPAPKNEALGVTFGRVDASVKDLKSTLTPTIRDGLTKVDGGVNSVKDSIKAMGPPISQGLDATRAATLETKRETTRGAMQTSAATRAGANSVVSAIYANRPIISVDVDVSSTSVVKQTVKVSRYGPTGGSRTSGGKGRGGLGGTIG